MDSATQEFQVVWILLFLLFGCFWSREKSRALLKFNDKSEKFESNQEVLDEILKIPSTSRIRVITFLGDAKVGRSTALNTIIHILSGSDQSHIEEIFPSDNTVVSVTRDVQIHILRPQNEGGDIFILLEVQGIRNVGEDASVYYNAMQCNVMWTFFKKGWPNQLRGCYPEGPCKSLIWFLIVWYRSSWISISISASSQDLHSFACPSISERVSWNLFSLCFFLFSASIFLRFSSSRFLSIFTNSFSLLLFAARLIWSRRSRLVKHITLQNHPRISWLWLLFHSLWMQSMIGWALDGSAYKCSCLDFHKYRYQATSWHPWGVAPSTRLPFGVSQLTGRKYKTKKKNCMMQNTRKFILSTGLREVRAICRENKISKN